jgi:hypothetical protein
MTSASTQPGIPSGSPFVGPSPFSEGNRRFFFGREREARELVNVLIAQRVVLLHAPSGAGKTSLVNARLIPDLAEAGFYVAPCIRVGLAPGNMASRSGNRYLDSLMDSIAPQDGNVEGPRAGETTPAAGLSVEATLARQIRDLLKPRADKWARDRASARKEGGGEPEAPKRTKMQLAIATKAAALRHAGKGGEAPEATHPSTPSGIVLIFDQFEEILTVDSIDLEAKRAFFERVGAALRDDLGLWALFSMREDYVASLEPYLAPMPKRLQVRYRIDLLDSQAAGLAISRPIEVAGASIKPEAVERLVGDLCKVRILNTEPGASGTAGFVDALGPYVEPVQLQVVCAGLWSRWREADPDSSEIVLDDVVKYASVDRALGDYYRDRMHTIATRDNAHDVELEMRIRQWVERQLITPFRVRSIVMRTPIKTQGLEDKIVDALVNQYLVRIDLRRGQQWLELAHDRLIDPVRKDNATWLVEHCAPFQLKAALWDEQGQPDNLLLPAESLAMAEIYARAHPNRMSDIDHAFLLKSKTHVPWAKYLVIKNLAVFNSIVAVVCLGLAIGCYLLYMRATAEAKNAKAETDRANKNETAAEEQLKATQFQMMAKEKAENQTIAAIDRVSQNQTSILIPNTIDKGTQVQTTNMIRKNSDGEPVIDLKEIGLVLKQIRGVSEGPVPVSLARAGELTSSLGNFNAIEIYDQTPDKPAFPLVWSDIVANGYLRSTYQKAEGPSAAMGTSVVTSLSYRSPGLLHLVPRVTNALLTTGGADRVRNELEANFSPDRALVASIRSIRSYPDPIVGRTMTGLSLRFEAVSEIALDAAQRGNDAFRLLTLSSMYSDKNVYDTNVIRYEDGDSKVHSVRLADLLDRRRGKRAFHLFPEGDTPHPVVLGRWFELVKEPGSTWFPDSPSIRVEIGDRSGVPGGLGIQGFLADTTLPTEDSLSVWIEWMDAPNPVPATTKLDLNINIVARAPGREDAEEKLPGTGGSLYFRDLPGVEGTPVPVTLDGRSVGSESVPGARFSNVVEIYDPTPGKAGSPMIWSDFVANTIVQPAYHKDDGSGSAQRTSLVASPSYRTPKTFQFIPIVSAAKLTTGGADRIRSELNARFESRPGIRSASIRRICTYPHPIGTRTTTGLTLQFEAEEQIPLDSTRKGNDFFRMLTLLSMYSSPREFDANVLKYADPAGQVHVVRLKDQTPRDTYLLPRAAELGAWFELAKEPGSTWFPDSPSIRVEIRDRSGVPGRLGIQGFLTRERSTSAKSLSVWVEWLDAPDVVPVQTKLDLGVDVIAQPPAQVEGG